MELQYVDGKILKNALISAACLLEKNKKQVDALNVFPVPDGDTGTNMSLTLMAAANEIKKSDSLNIEEIADLAAKGSLRGARGNSGVILSQLLRGFAKALRGKKQASTLVLAEAFQKAALTAYKAVMKPTEGTILTVARQASEHAVRIAPNEKDINKFMADVVKSAQRSLEKTPDMLPVLKQAGVVDAGGKGLIYILMGATQDISTDFEIASDTVHPEADATVHIDDEIVFGYCTEFIINDTESTKIETFRKTISGYGDSMLVVGDDSIIKVHIHTNNPGKILEYAVELGELSDIKIDNMRRQHRSIVFNDQDDINNEDDKVTEIKEISIIAVAAGDGLKKIFKDLGVDYVISGGQTMNPSAEDILDAVEKLNSDNIIILPNNSNIIMTAEQTTHLTEKKIHVIPTKTIPQGISALIAFNQDLDVYQNVERMVEALNMVKTGQVTYAIRDTDFDGMKIKKDDILGILDKKINNSGSDIDKVALELIDSMVDDDSEIITIYAGDQISEQQGEQLKKELEQRYEDYEVELYMGGQPVYYYIISVE
ncbi:MAG: DAK2 domain-containing protein [Clostridia bacterium]|nr:DAK2 domain-containing protein [Clostridia bacterium]